MKPIFSASEADRAMSCPASLTLPRVQEPAEARTERGSAVHLFLSDGVVPEDPRTAAYCLALDLDALPVDPGSWGQEVALALDLTTGAGRELGRGLQRDYSSATSQDVVGTADVIGLTDDAVVVLDFKTGFGGPRAADSWQLRVLAAAACAAYGRTQARVGLIRLKESGDAWWDMANLDALDVATVVHTLQTLKAEIERKPSPTPGDWCRYCPAFQACPSQVGLLRQMVDEPGQLADELLASLTPERASLVYERYQQIEQVMARVHKALYGFAQEHPIHLRNGRVFGPVETKREYLDGPETFQLLKTRYGEDIALQACELKTSKAGLDRALKSLAQSTGEKVAPLRRAVLADLAAVGAIEVKTGISTKEHDPKEGAE